MYRSPIHFSCDPYLSAIHATARAAATILSFKDKTTELVFSGKCPKGFPTDAFKVARRKLEAVNAAAKLEDLASPPGNKLHRLAKDRQGEHAIWINDQYWVCFAWTPAGPENVEIVDYH
jgi:proteic killer suppression protein